MVLAELGPAQAGSSRPDWCRYRHARTRPNGRSAPARHRERGSSPALPSERRLRPATVSCAIAGQGSASLQAGPCPPHGRVWRRAEASRCGWPAYRSQARPASPPARWRSLVARDPIGGGQGPHPDRPTLPRAAGIGSGGVSRPLVATVGPTKVGLRCFARGARSRAAAWRQPCPPADPAT